MKGLAGYFPLLLSLLLIGIEIISYWSIRLFIKKKIHKYYTISYLCIAILHAIIWFIAIANPEAIRTTNSYGFFYFAFSFALLNIIPKLIISVGYLLSMILHWIKRSLTYSFLGTFILLALISELTILHGIVIGKNDVEVRHISLTLPSLPSQLNKLKVAQISDLHLGSFSNLKTIEQVVDLINSEDVDVILFTGDVVNNFHQEMEQFESTLSKLKSKHGKFAVLGNHDYGNYSNWEYAVAKAENQKKIIKGIESSGFTLLKNENVKISMADTSFYILGVENWGRMPFPQYGILEESLRGIPTSSFKLLMSHDPAHWEEQVTEESNIQLTFSGHTHGAQLGIRLAGITFSPIYGTQKHWAGLYKNGNQFLYTNQGMGSVGFPGRIDMNPEITILTLKSDI